ncbi:hypothetical protein K443DRAFT_402184 [Laccaria amethystina LaAM-08-1]|uniref:Uncharacterized protein n=1 Tax=Laccaria amethystina LaAM-08-1 TaxID=1095629 RepID=A0A0C9WQD0_9AGAR|nr:hypothetical protein K443DRAFT_402184 [Laccaria amethystina LaAM-08-1]
MVPCHQQNLTFSPTYQCRFFCPLHWTRSTAQCAYPIRRHAAGICIDFLIVCAFPECFKPRDISMSIMSRGFL